MANRITIVGVGQVGMAAAYTLLSQVGRARRPLCKKHLAAMQETPGCCFLPPLPPPPTLTFLSGWRSCGALSAHYATTHQRLVGHLVLSDVQRDKLNGEVLDLQHAGAFLPFSSIEAASEDVHETKNSDVVIITAGVRQREGEVDHYFFLSFFLCFRRWLDSSLLRIGPAPTACPQRGRL